MGPEPSPYIKDQAGTTLGADEALEAAGLDLGRVLSRLKTSISPYWPLESACTLHCPRPLSQGARLQMSTQSDQ